MKCQRGSLDKKIATTHWHETGDEATTEYGDGTGCGRSFGFILCGSEL